MLVGFCVVFQCGGRKVIRKQAECRFDIDHEDQYSLPACSSHINSLSCSELGPNTTQLLSVLRVLEGNDTGLDVLGDREA